MSKVLVAAEIPEELASWIDGEAERLMISRSAVMRQIIASAAAAESDTRLRFSKRAENELNEEGGK